MFPPATQYTRRHHRNHYQVMATICEDGATCMIIVELADGEMFGRSFDWPVWVPFDEADVLAELQRLEPSRCVH